MPYAEKLLSLTQITKQLESNHIKEIFESPNLVWFRELQPNPCKKNKKHHSLMKRKKKSFRA